MSDAYSRFTFASSVAHTREGAERKNFRAALSHYPTGVAVVTALGENNARIGLTVNSFISLSLHPPLILWGVGRRAPSAAAFAVGKRFVVNLLAAHQEDVAQRFAKSAPDKFSGIAYEDGVDGVPILADTLGWLEARVDTMQPAGDHMLVIGEVDHFAHRQDGEPLVYHRSRYKTFGA
jgi:flavin reductase (DIM6/NTAB) family NADH-FMN oxidoreductase RutF